MDQVNLTKRRSLSFRSAKRGVGIGLLATLTVATAQVKPAVATPSSEPEGLAARDYLSDSSAFIAERKKSLRMANQKTDIFGRAQSLYKPEPKRSNKRLAAAKPVKPKVPLGPILARIPITMLDTASNRVLLESGEALRAGEIIEVAASGQTIQLRLDAVRRQGAYFRNMANGELGLATMSGLADGISRDGGGSSATGIQRISRGQPRTIQLNNSSRTGDPSSQLSDRR